MKTGIELIAAERTRQMDEEGWSPSHDDEHTDAELARAAHCYTKKACFQIRFNNNSDSAGLRLAWPWDECWWKPSDDPIRNLVKAGALIAAEIDRLLRKQQGNAIGHDPGLLSKV